MPVIDLHQHLLPPGLLDALRRRERPPRQRGRRLELAAGAVFPFDPDEHRLERRLAALDRHGIGRAVVSLPPALLGDGLAAEEEAELRALYEEGIREAVADSGGRLAALSAGGALDGFAGACVGAGRLAELDGLAPLLDALEARGAFLFVHPGPLPAEGGRPPWWPAAVQEALQLQEAWTAWLARGVERWPRLSVVFASLAGGGPFQLERLRAFGVGSRELDQERVFLETSSYGRRALELCLATFGVDRVVFGSDAPILDPDEALQAVRVFGDAVQEALCDTNPSKLLA